MATIFGGKKRKEFTIHRELLCKVSNHFAKAFQSGLKEGEEGIIYLPEDSSDEFSLFVDVSR
jgi:hypothetical protein